jgi:hypothetical protein
MAKVNKPDAVKGMTGLASLTKGAMLAAGPDNVPAVIQNQQGQNVAPAAIKEGEIIFSVEAVMGAGEGDYDLGAERLLKLHEQLKSIGRKLLGQNSLAAYKGE